MLYRLLFLQLLVLHIKLCASKIYLKTLGDVDLASDDTESIVFMFPQSLRSKSLSIEDLEPSKSLIVGDRNPVDDEITVENLNLSKRQKDILRKKWRSSCDRKASKVCVKACKSTVKIVCSSHKCRKSMKKSFKKECKRNCKSRFISSKDSDTE